MIQAHTHLRHVLEPRLRWSAEHQLRAARLATKAASRACQHEREAAELLHRAIDHHRRTVRVLVVTVIVLLASIGVVARASAAVAESHGWHSGPGAPTAAENAPLRQPVPDAGSGRSEANLDGLAGDQSSTSTTDPGRRPGREAPSPPTVPALAAPGPSVELAGCTDPSWGGCRGWTPEREAAVANAAAEFGVPAGRFRAVLGCESGGNQWAVNSSSGALGLGQHLPEYWGGRAAALGYPYEAWSDSIANARVSAWLWATSGSGHWRACGG